MARMQSAIPPGPPGPVTPEFKIRWLRSVRLPFTLMSHLKVGSSSLARSKDDVELSSDSGQELLYVAYRKPEWHWGLRDQYQEPGEERKDDKDDIDPAKEPDIRRALFPHDWAIRCEEANRAAMSHQLMPHARGREHFLEGDQASFVFSCTQYTFRECMEKGLFGAIPELQEQVMYRTVSWFISTLVIPASLCYRLDKPFALALRFSSRTYPTSLFSVSSKRRVT